MKKVVIIGGVAGGASCAARLRRLDETASIVLLERGEYISYANCGLPYHVGDVIKSRRALLLQTPEAMQRKSNIDVRVLNEAVSIDRAKKTVLVRRVDTGETYAEPYDVLVLSAGSSPLRPPIPGIDSTRIHTLWTVPDTDRIRAIVHEQGVKSAAVIGGGFIGLEMAENLVHVGLEVSLIEALDQVMSPIDFEMAQLLHENLSENGVHLHLSDAVEAFHETDGGVDIRLKSGRTVHAELVILSIGVRPNGQLAKDAGLSVNARGGVVVDDHMRTSDPSIYALGDMAEVQNFVSKEQTMIPLAGPANKQGRLVADNIAGGDEVYRGTQGSAIAKVFDLTAASTGENEKTLTARGLVRGKDFESVTITQNSHASYYPGATPMTLKLLFARDGGKILGAQIVGRDGVDKRIDTIGVAMRLGATAPGLKELEFAYAPPYSSAKDPVNMLGFMAENVLSGMSSIAPWDIAEKDENVVLLDVREAAELAAYKIPGAVHIPLWQVRDRLGELDRSKKIVVFCAIGVRAHNAARILSLNGFPDVAVYPGGARFFRSTHYEAADSVPFPKNTPVLDSGRTSSAAAPDVALRVDCGGLRCPDPIREVVKAMDQLKEGQVMEITTGDPGFARDIENWARRTGNTIAGSERCGADCVTLIQKGSV